MDRRICRSVLEDLYMDVHIGGISEDMSECIYEREGGNRSPRICRSVWEDLYIDLNIAGISEDMSECTGGLVGV